MVVRGAGFALAIGIVAVALFAGTVLRGSDRALSAAPAASMAQEAKDQNRVVGSSEGPLSAQEAVQSASRHADASAPSGPEPEWRDEEFAFVDIVDGRTLRAGGITITLDGLELPHPDQVCRTLDDRLEQCVARAATQLELLTRSRRLACRYRMTTSSEATGSCRIGSRDLAERMVRTGYARVSSKALTATASEAETSAR